MAQAGGPGAASGLPEPLVWLMKMSVPASAAFFLAMFTCIVLMCIPHSLTKHIAYVDGLRSYLLGRCYFYWQLSLEGPLFKLIGGCGKRFGGGRLASICKTPKAFKVKVNSISEIEVAWTPQPPANPFHEEFYVISYCQLSDDGEAGEWIERVLTEEEYHKKEKERPKEVGKSQRRRLKLTDLPEKTKFKLRVCADGPGGRSKFSPEVLESTFAKPDEKTMGLTGPLHKDAPTTESEYRWWQSKHEVGLDFSVPADWKGKDLTVKVLPKTDGYEFRMVHEKGTLLSGTLGGKVKVEEVDWVIESDGKGGKAIKISMKKEKVMQLWECFVDGHQRVDPALLKLFYEGNSMIEFSSPDIWE